MTQTQQNLSLIGLIPSLIIGCNSNLTTPSNNNSSTGNLTLVANGEDLIRQGLTTKDGWKVQFDNVSVTLDQVTAYQVDSSFEPQANQKIKPLQTVVLVDTPITVNLAEGDENAEPIFVVTKEVPSGHYNALAWQVRSNNNEPSIILEGIANKGEQNIQFTLKLNPTLNYQCGEFVGEERKGFVNSNETTDLEVTFHFDHLFGNIELGDNDTMNLDALGFTPLANLAENGTLIITQDLLKEKLESEDYQKLEHNLQNLGHVGEGHCEA
jgi:hypothetical protein